MGKVSLRAAACCFVVSLLRSAGGLAGQEVQLPNPAERQLRPEFSVSLPIRPRLGLQLSGQAHLAHRAGGLVQSRGGLTVQWRASPALMLASGYQHLVQTRETGPPTTVQRASIGASVRLLSTAGFELTDRSLVEGMYRAGVWSARYRNRVTLKRPVRLLRGETQLYLSDEIFYDSRYDAFVRNQLSVGGERSLGGRFTGDLYLMRQDDGRAGDLFVLGTRLRMRL